MNSREEKKCYFLTATARLFCARLISRARFHDAALYILYRYRDCSFNTLVRYRLYGKTKFSLSMVSSMVARVRKALSILYLCAIVFLDRCVEIVSFVFFTHGMNVEILT